MSQLFICIYSGGQGREVCETFAGGMQVIKVWEPLVYSKSCYLATLHMV
jgi:hypothetical protein